MKALVAGSTGKTGSHIVKLLLEKGIEVRALVRNLDKANSVLPETVEKVIGDVMNRESLTTVLAGCDVLLSATGAEPSFDPTGPYKVDYEGNKNLVDAAKAAGIDQFVMVSSLCVSKIFHPLNLFWGILYWKQQAEDYLKASGVPYTIVRPGGLKDEDNAQAIVMSPADTLFEGSIPRVKVARVCVDAIGQDMAKNKVLEIVTSAEATTQPIETLFASIG